ncbi:MAG: NADH-quinone oxidoreductase subunit NuoE [Myxococcota bacterium]|jgi:NADH-quinone oxidoreductase subunit E|nr:NADH-quinone oxidoreductase subunit NuoE [Myxococcota bacterium]
MSPQSTTEIDEQLDRLIERYGRDRSALIPILQDVQEQQGYLSRASVIRIAERLGLPASKVYGVATFYNQFRFQAPGKYALQVCRGTACHVRGSLALVETLKRELGVEAGQTTKDGLFSLEEVACLGVCGLAPVIAINGEILAAVAPNAVKPTLRKYRRAAEAEAKQASNPERGRQ